jgi:hypothetical protein
MVPRDEPEDDMCGAVGMSPGRLAPLPEAVSTTSRSLPTLRPDHPAGQVARYFWRPKRVVQRR